MYKRNQLYVLTVATTLSSAAFCLHTVPTKPQERVIRHGTLFVGNQRQYFSVGDTDGYQADQPEAEVGYQLAELKLQQLRPSVQCDNDSMSLRMLGKRVPDFLVERDGKSPVPLSEMPAHCGLSVRRARRDVFLVAKYDGCHMTQEGDNYILPLRLWGVPVKMGCPVEALFLTVSCTLSAMVIQVGISVDVLKLKVNGEWQPVTQACETCGFTLEAVPSEWVVTAPYSSKCWQIEGDERLLSVLYSNGELTLSCPLDTTPLPAAGELSPLPPIPPMDNTFPYPGNQFWNQPFNLGYPGTPPRSPTPATTAATSPTAAAATVTTTSANERLWNPYGHARNWLFYPGYPGFPGPLPGSSTPALTTPFPTTATTTTNPTTAATTTAKPPGADERFWNPYGHARNWLFYPGYPGAYGYPGHPGPPPRSPTPVPTTPVPTTPAPTTPAPTTPVPTTPASTTATTSTNPTTAASTAAKPLGADEHFWNPYGYPKHWLYYPNYPGAYGYPDSPPRNPTTTATNPTPTSTTSPTTAATIAKPPDADGRFWNPYGHARYWRFYPGYPGGPPMTPTHTASTTTTTTPPPPTSPVRPPPSADQQQHWSPFPWFPTMYDPSGYSNAGQAYQTPWMPYPPRHGRDQKGLLPVATASVVNGAASVSPKWFYPPYQRPGAPQLQTSAAMSQPYSWPMYLSTSKQSSKDTVIDPKLTFDQMFASRGWSSLLYPAQLSPLQVKAGPVHKDRDLVPNR